MIEERWRKLARGRANRGRVITAFLAHHMAQQEIKTLRELAERLGVTQGTISYWKTTEDAARTIPENKTLARLVEILGCTQDDLYEAFGLRPTPQPVDAITQEIAQIVSRLSPSDQELIRELAWARLQQQSQRESSQQVHV